MSPETPELWLLAVHTAATLFMTGLIWFVQVVHYPLFGQVGCAGFPTYERLHSRNTAWVVGPPMLVELGTAILVAMTVGGTLASSGLALVAVIWGSTWMLQVPAHTRLARGFDAATHCRLVRTNWVRTAAWSLRGVIAMVMFAQGR